MSKVVLSTEAMRAFRVLENAMNDLATEAEKCGAGMFAHDVRGTLSDKLYRLVDVCDVCPLNDNEGFDHPH